jgi:hypothetical protein
LRDLRLDEARPVTPVRNPVGSSIEPRSTHTRVELRHVGGFGGRMSVDNEGCSDEVSLPQVFDVRVKARQEFRESRADGGLAAPAGFTSYKAADRGILSGSASPPARQYEIQLPCKA